jgi:hypothetical protein
MMKKSSIDNVKLELLPNNSTTAQVTTSSHNSSKPNAVCSAVGIPCEVCGEIIIVEKGIVAEEDCDIPPVCGKCYTEYYADYMQSLRTGYNY